MAGGLRYKLQGSTIQFLTDWHADSPSDSVSAISKANPAVVTSASHGRSSGEVVRIGHAVGMTEVNDIPAIIQRLSANTYSLLGKNSTDYGTYTSGGRVDVATFSTLCELTGFNRTGGQSPQIPASTQCSEEEEYEIGLPSSGSVQVDFNFAPGTTVQQAIDAAYYAGDTIAYKVTLPKSGGTLVQLAIVQQTGEAVQVNGIWTASMTLLCTGRRYYFAAA